jgi:hypothetical protein
VLMLDKFDGTMEASAIGKEANEIVEEALIPKEASRTFIKTPKIIWEDIKDFAKSLRVHPAIVVGRIRYEWKKWNIFSRCLSPENRIRHLFV